MSRWRLWVTSLPLVWLVACGAQLNNEQAALTTQQHYEHWLSMSEDYQITFQQQCYCLPEYLQPMRLTVRDNKLISAIFVNDGSPVPAAMLKDLPTVKEIFETVIEAELRPAEIIKIEFDQQHHYPTKVDIDYDLRMADEEIQWQLSNPSFATN